MVDRDDGHRLYHRDLDGGSTPADIDSANDYHFQTDHDINTITASTVVTVTLYDAPDIGQPDIGQQVVEITGKVQGLDLSSNGTFYVRAMFDDQGNMDPDDDEWSLVAQTASTAPADTVSLYTVTVDTSASPPVTTSDQVDASHLTIPNYQPAEFRYVTADNGTITREKIVERTETYVIQLGDAPLDVAFTESSPGDFAAMQDETSDILRYTSLEDAIRKATLDKAMGMSPMPNTTQLADETVLQWATYEGAVLYANNPYIATVTFRFMDDNITFNYRISGPDRDDVELVQVGNDVFLQTRAGPDYDRPTDADNSNSYEITEYITTNFDFQDDTLESVMNTYTLTVLDVP
jgi:hypothetical protein